MRKGTYYLPGFILIFYIFQSATAQNVGIGTITPAYKLTVQTPSNNWGFVHTDSTVTVGSYIFSNGPAEIGTRSAHPFWLFAGNHDNPSPAIAIDAGGVNVGLGTITPVNHLQIGNAPGFSGNDIAIGNGTQAMSFYQSGTASNWYSNTNFALMPNGGNGLVGIGTPTPSNKLEVFTKDASYGMVQSNGSVQVGSYIGSNGGWLGTKTPHPLYFFTNNSNAQVALTTSGNLGIGTISPANNLQIGSVGSTGYGGNQIAFGNGTQASGITQTGTTAQWYSTTNISLMPQGNGHGRVGINTTTPSVPLEVDDYVSTLALLNLSGTDYGGFDYFRVGGYNGGVNSFGADVGGLCHSCYADVSIYAYGNVMATEFDAISDARMKDVKGISNTAKDLATINTIEVVDYTMKDKVKNGNKPFKKVVAQQVETVYPQVVSRHVDFIPNVYRVASKIEKTDQGYLLHFDSAHHISKGAAKIKAMASGDNVMNKYDIVSVPSDNEVVINATKLNGDKIFVYGEEVKDFLTVDYEGLTTLNISATQELSKIIKQQQAAIDAQNENIKALQTKVEQLQGEIKEFKKNNSALNVQRVN